MRSTIGLFISFLLAAPVAAQPTTAPATSSSTSDGDRPTVVVVVGAGGEPEYAAAFSKWSARWAAAAKQRGAELTQIGGDGSSDEMNAPATSSATALSARPSAISQTIQVGAATNPSTTSESDEGTDRQKLRMLLEKLPKDGTAPLWLVLIGHGTYDGKEAKFNLRGPDVSDQDLGNWLSPFHRPLVVIDCSSSSAPFLSRVAAKGRIVITATRSGSEINFSRFGDYLSTAIDDPSADLDKDGQTSLLEAFLAASHGVEEFYKQDSRLATEHALLDDNGDGKGISADWFDGLRAVRRSRDNTPLDGPRARQWHLVISASEQAIAPELRAERDQLEMQLEDLRGKKASLPEALYFAQLEKIMLDLAHVYQRASLLK